MRLATALAALVLGIATAAAAVVLHDITWTAVLEWIATLLTLRALPAGLPGRLPYALGWMAVLAVAVTRTPGGGYLIESSTSGYAVLVLGLVVLSVGIATYPLKRRSRLAGDDQGTRDLNDLAG